MPTCPTLAGGLRLAVCAAALAAVATPSFAESFYLKEQSVRGAGRAYSGETADTGVSSLWWNPASIARSGREVYVGLHGILLDSDVDNAGSSIVYPGGTVVPVNGPVGSNHNGDPIESGIVPNFAFAMPIGDRFAVGISVAAPYNFTTKYQPGSFTRYDALTSELRSGNVGLTAALRVNDWLDIGAGLDIQYVEATLTSSLPNLSPLLPDGRSTLQGDGVDYGWNAGVQAHKGPWDLGLSYRSAIEHELDGDVNISGLLGPIAAGNVSTGGTATFSTPWFASASVRYAVNDRLTLNGQVNRVGWSEFDAIRVRYGAGGDTIVQDYKDTTGGSVGFDYVVNERVTARGGIAYDPTPTQAGERTGRIPDGDRMLYSGGLSIKATDSVTVDTALTYIALDDSDIAVDRTFYAGTAADTTSRLRGRASGQGIAASIGARWAF
ncbi:outer membrane protein transport protein [Brevundimonas sp. NIBR11]|uniref:OmpP1/FadL family transporter n=1 Tax=Brevundimonas sp. NIBR11 TaxID=3015999 RepID=UPI0022EFDAB2|nr:outer membrane protein transport protein [Brevundimonas sp. NIBR11]WGM32010.1 Long-chain fatty acid transport protein [Brevundimonas sp. NIBR11]